MNRQTFNLFLIVLLALTIMVVAHNHNYNHNHNHKTTITETASQTITVTKTCSSNEPTPEITCPVQNDKRRHNRHDYYKVTKTVTCTPTTTVCATPTPTCCEAPGSPGFQNIFHQVVADGIIIPLSDITSPQDCCKSCFANVDCFQWVFRSGTCQNHVNGPTFDNCENPTVNLANSGIVRCSDDSGNCLA